MQPPDFKDSKFGDQSNVLVSVSLNVFFIPKAQYQSGYDGLMKSVITKSCLIISLNYLLNN